MAASLRAFIRQNYWSLSSWLPSRAQGLSIVILPWNPNSNLYMCVYVCAQLCLTLCNPPGLQPAELLCLWNSISKNTGVGCHFLLQGIFPTQGLNPCFFGLLYWQEYSLPAVPTRKPESLPATNKKFLHVICTDHRSSKV